MSEKNGSDDDDLVVMEMMPDYLRGSHKAAGNWGWYPNNGSERYLCPRGVAEDIIGYDADGYDHIVRDATEADIAEYDKWIDPV